MVTPRSVQLFLVVGLIAASQSGNIIRLAEAPAVIIAAWRLTLAALLFTPIAHRQLATLKALSRGELLLLFLAGTALAAHFITWISAVQHTTVANAAIFFSINPVLTAVAGHLIFKEPLSARLLGSIALGLVGCVLLGLHDFKMGSEHLLGDGLAVLCSILFTVYFLLGKRLRQSLVNQVYVTALYAVAAGMSFFVVLVRGLPLTTYSGRSWLSFVLMALVPTMIGHTALNGALRYMDAGRISTYTLSEPLFAGLVAYVAWGEAIHPHTIGGYALISCSVVLLFLEHPS